MFLSILYFILLLPAENGGLLLTGINLIFFFYMLNKVCCSYEQEIKVYIKEKSTLWKMLHSQVR